MTIQNPRNRGGSTGHVLAKRSVTFTEIRTEDIRDVPEQIQRRQIGLFLKVDPAYGKGVADALGLKLD
ncbi:hypothetical protein EGT57_29500 [Pseudomonas aeruginosa]|nr:hypothetical protein EGT57_29500 [Pseudomonas aeruginosa]